MKNLRPSASTGRVLAGFILITICCGPTLRAGDIIKGASGTDLSAGAAWAGTVPSSSDVARWNLSSLGGTLTLGATTGATISWQGINVQNAASAITITGGASGQTLSIGSAGINVSGVNLTLGGTNSPAIKVNGNQTWTISSGRRLLLDNSTLTVDPGVTTGGWLIVNNASGTGASSGLTLSANSGTFDFGKATISGVGSIFANGSSSVTLKLGDANTFTGTTELRGGGKTIQYTTLAAAGSNSSFGAGTGALVTVGNNGGAYTLENTGAGGSTSRAISVGATTTGLSLLNNGSGSIAFNDSSTAINMTAGLVTLGGASGSNTLATAIQGAGTGGTSVSKTGASFWTLSGANSYTGGTSITGGTLGVSSDGNLGTAPGSAATNLILNGGTLSALASFTLADTRGIAIGPGSGSGGGTLNVASGRTLIYGGVIANNGGTGALTKTGSGTLALSGASTYTGGTFIDGGTLKLQAGGSISASPLVRIASGATLDTSGMTGGVWTVQGTGPSTRQTLSGSGTVTGATVIGAYGTHSVGGSGIAGSQSFGSDLAYTANAIIEWDLNANKDSTSPSGSNGVPGINYDAVTVGGNLNIDGGTIFRVIKSGGVDFTSSFWSQNHAWDDIFSASGTSTSGWSNTAVSVFDPSGILQDVSPEGYFTMNGTTLNWTAVPEPGIVPLLAGLGLLTLLRRCR